MNAKRTEPRVHCWQRPINGAYVRHEATTPERLRAVFDAERERIAQADAPRRKRKPRQAKADQQPKQGQLQLVQLAA